MGAVNGNTPNSGLLASPVGTPVPPLLPPKLKLPVCPFSGRTNGFSPPMGASSPADVNKPHFINSRRDTWPSERALAISARLRLAFSASRSRDLSASSGSQKLPLRSLRPIMISPCVNAWNAFRTAVRKQRRANRNGFQSRTLRTTRSGLDGSLTAALNGGGQAEARSAKNRGVEALA